MWMKTVLFPSLLTNKNVFYYKKLFYKQSWTLMQTPGSPIAGGKSGGRETSKRIILVCNGSTQGNTEVWNNGQNEFDKFLKIESLFNFHLKSFMWDIKPFSF